MKQKTHEIKVIGSIKSFPCREDEFLLEAMKRAGSGPIHYGCYGGGCGVCKMMVESGMYASEKKMSRAHVTEQEQKTGVVLICCVKPRSDMEISKYKK